MTESPQFIGLLGQREIVLIRKILHENNATEEEMKKLFEETVKSLYDVIPELAEEDLTSERTVLVYKLPKAQ